MTGTYTLRVAITEEESAKLTSGEVVEISNTGGYDLSRVMGLNKAIYVELSVANTLVLTIPAIKSLYIENLIVATFPPLITGNLSTMSISAINDTIIAMMK